MTRVVIAHDYLTQRGGAERVVLALLAAFPQARIVTSVYWPEGTFPEFRDLEIETILPASIPLVNRDPRLAVAILPLAFRRHRIRDADVVVCSSSGWAHGIASDAPKVVYCHTPARWLYEQADFLIGQPAAVRLLVHAASGWLRRWDVAAAASATSYVANSTAVRERIRRAYGRDAVVVHPPVMIDPREERTPLDVSAERFLLTIARGRGYKNSGLVEAAARATGRPLVIVGSRARRSHPSTIHVGQVSDAELRWLYANCDALVAAAHEDFGLTPLEAMAFGKPVIALRGGGYLDSIVEGVTGIFFDRPDVKAIAAAIRAFDTEAFDGNAIRRHALTFSTESFATRMHALVDPMVAS